MASYNPIGGGVVAIAGGSVAASVLPQTGVTTTLEIALSAAFALAIWAGFYLLGQRKVR